jgi:Leucine-rich repeat (LRR) protein
MIFYYLQASVEGIVLKCTYYHTAYTSANLKQCDIPFVDLSNIFREESFEFSVEADLVSETTSVWFHESPYVDFIPPAVVDKFPNLFELGVYMSNVPIIKNELFSSKFYKIKELSITFSKTEFIEEKAFQPLKNLEELDLSENKKLKSLTSTFFSNNAKLKRIDLSSNEIMIINPKLFENFNHLIFINLLYNKCISDKFGCDDCNDVIDHEELNRELSACYFNCFVDNECGKNLNAIVEFKCEYSKKLFEITEELNFKAQQCKITELKFPTKSSATSEKFSGSKDEKQNVTMLDFNRKISIDKIPREIYEEFPSLRQVKISNMRVGVLQNIFFPTDFLNIEYLDLSRNEIKHIEENTFENLVNLTWLNL